MVQLIEKDALVAELEKTYNFHKKRGGKHDASICDVLYGLLHRIDTLEVKEVNLEKSISDWLSEGLPNDEEEIDYIKETAKHFFELGLKAKGE